MTVDENTEAFYSPAELANKAFYMAYGLPILHRYYDDDRDGDTDSSCRLAMDTFLQIYCQRYKKTKAQAMSKLKAGCTPIYQN